MELQRELSYGQPDGSPWRAIWLSFFFLSVFCVKEVNLHIVYLKKNIHARFTDRQRMVLSRHGLHETNLGNSQRNSDREEKKQLFTSAVYLLH